VNNKGLLVALLALAAVSMVVVLMYVTYNNAEVSLRNQTLAQQQNVLVVFDATWKIIVQKAGVSQRYAQDFKEIYPALMEGRYGDARGGALMSWVTEHNPQFDTSLYQDLMHSIEAERIRFARAQTRLLDLKREHDNVRQTLPCSLFVGSRPPIEVKLVTSARTDEAFETGQENNVDLFGRE